MHMCVYFFKRVRICYSRHFINNNAIHNPDILRCILLHIIFINYRSKRQSADLKAAEYLAWIALGGQVPSDGCRDVACGVVDVYSR